MFHFKMSSGISWLRGNAECLPVASDNYDAYTVAFGIRNMTHMDAVRIGDKLIHVRMLWHAWKTFF